MKKTLITILFLFCAISVFAETGYKSIEWYTPTEQVKEKLKHEKRADIPQEETEDFYESIYIKQPIYGDLENVIYNVSCGGLQSVTYLIPTKKAKKIAENYKKKIVEYKAYTNQIENLKNQIKENLEKEPTNTLMLLEVCHSFQDMAMLGEYKGFNYLSDKFIEKDNNKGRIIIYDYNDDTRVYIYENIIEGQTVVVYVPHEQDY